MYDVFISYAREDRQFVIAICSALDERGHSSWLDEDDIPPAADFPPEVEAGIEAADSFAFVLSPDSAVSEWCERELQHAVKHAKRLVPVLRRDLEQTAVPDPLRTPNWIKAREDDDFEEAVGKLVEAMVTDLPWVRQHTRLTTRATEWENSRLDASFLLRGADLESAELWLNEAARGREQTPSPLQQAYIKASQEARERERKEALGRQLAELADQTREEEPALLPRSVLLAVESMRRVRSDEGYRALRSGLALLPTPVATIEHEGRVMTVAFAPDGRRTVSGSQDGSAVVWDIEGNQAVTRVEHVLEVRAAEFSPDGRWIATASEDKRACLWDTETGEQLAVMPHDAPVNSVEFSQDGRLLLTASGLGLGPDIAAPGTAWVWETGTGRELARAPHSHLTALTFMPLSEDGRFVVSASHNNHVVMWDSATAEQAGTTRHEDVVVALACHPTSPLLAATCLDMNLFLWDLQEARLLATIELGNRASPVVFSPKGRWFAAVTGEGAVRVWETETLHEVARIPHKSAVTALVFGPDERLLAAVSHWGNVVHLWKLHPGGPAESARVAHDQAFSAVFSPDGASLASVSDRNAAWVWKTSGAGDALWEARAGGGATLRVSPDGRLVATGGAERANTGWISAENPLRGVLCVFDAATGAETARISHDRLVSRVEFSADSTRVAAVSGDRAWLWDAYTGTALGSLAHEGRVNDLSYSPAEDRIATGGADTIARVWDGASLRELSRAQHDGPVLAVAFSPDGLRVASAGEDGTTLVWDAATGREIARVSLPEPPVWRNPLRLVFSPDGKWLASPSTGNAATVWDAATGREVASRQYPHAVIDLMFSPDGGRLLAAAASLGGDASSGVVDVWEVESGRVLLEEQLERPAKVVAFSPDGQWIAAGEGDGGIRVWSAGTREELARLDHHDSINGISFHPNRPWLASTSQDETVRLWLWRPEDLIEEACRRLARDLTPEEWSKYIGPGEEYAATRRLKA